MNKELAKEVTDFLQENRRWLNIKGVEEECGIANSKLSAYLSGNYNALSPKTMQKLVPFLIRRGYKPTMRDKFLDQAMSFYVENEDVIITLNNKYFDIMIPEGFDKIISTKMEDDVEEIDISMSDVMRYARDNKESLRLIVKR